MKFKLKEKPYKVYTKLLEKFSKHMDFGKVFVTDRRYYSDEDLTSEQYSKAAMVDHSSKYTNMYLPFDLSTLFMMTDYGDETRDDLNYQMISFEDNGEHLLTSPINFKILQSSIDERIISGRIRLLEKEKLPDEKGIYDVLGIDRRYPVRVNTGVFENYAVVVECLALSALVTVPGRRITVDLTTDKIPGDDKNSLSSTTLMFATAAFLYFFSMMADPKVFVVEEQPVLRGRKGKRYKDTPPLFRAIDIKKIRKSYIKRDTTDKQNIDGPNIKVGFERRRHKRTYRNDRYVNMKGKTQIIEPIWIGPTEAISSDQNTLYKVRLDIG